MERRTDLALEARELFGEDIKGVTVEEEDSSDIHITRLKIRSDSACRKLNKEKGTYVTLELPPLTDSFRDPDERLEAVAQEIRHLLPVNGLVLIAGLGNTEITPDALGPKTASKILATRHIKGEIARSTGLDSLRPVAVVATGVTGKTGIETGEYLLSIIKKIKPNAIIAVDALASRRLSRLGCTLQISNTGISPGAGVGNNRTRLTKETLGIPVIGIGVPTVVDASTLALDLFDTNDAKLSHKLRSMVNPSGRQMVVTPKEIDLLVNRASELIALSINYALHPNLSISDLMSLMY
ncbi:MAG: GPR endopeptidase [Ruminococcus sp.]|nr:GPR endopeptidase [Ruminococcus sp.]